MTSQIVIDSNRHLVFVSDKISGILSVISGNKRKVIDLLDVGVSGKLNIAMMMDERIPQYPTISKQGGDKLIDLGIDVHKKKCIATIKANSTTDDI
ncbi:hypothetical protein [Nitrosopumilus ureiphilus]|nr:hypothetical protein [Nitrosopumilus ureiphilus]